MPLKDIFCQEKAISAIQSALAGDKVAHAYIFAGPDGVGKFTAAKELAKLLLCKNPVKKSDFIDSCCSCESCRMFDAGSHSDFSHVYKELVEFTKDGKGKTAPVEFPIDVVREFVLDKVNQRPALSTRRVFVLSEAEKLNNESQNCLLKVLEEPPAYCCIILTCTQPGILLPTIRSRCQILRFGPINEEKIIEKLVQSGLGEKQAKFFARLTDGSLGLAGAYSQLETGGANVYRMKTAIVNAMADLEYKNALELADGLQKQVKEIVDIWAKLASETSVKDIKRKSTTLMLQIIISAFHDAMLAGVGGGEKAVNFDQADKIKKIAGRLNPEQAAGKIAECFKTYQYIEASVNERLILEQLLLNLAQSDKITSEL
jgi:DNA polymerase III subunit delta'